MTNQAPQVDDIVVTNFGVTMVLPVFYKVVKRTPKSMKVRALRSREVDGDGMVGHCIPVDEYDEGHWATDISVRLQPDGTGWYAKHRLYFTRWNGTPQYFNHLD
jgi:hypothetical protein